MKNFLLKNALGIALVFSLHAAASAQVSVNINIGSQPAWGPTGYNHVDYYYLPDIESYYDVNSGQYIYLNGGQWIYSRALPPRYANYDLYSGYKVVVNRPKPYLNFSRDRVTYASYRNWHGNRQPMLRESRTVVNNRTVINNNTNVRVNRPGNNGNHFGNGNNGGNNGRGNPQDNRGLDNRGNNGRGNMQDNRSFDNRGQGNQHDDRGHGDDRGHH